MDRRRFLSALGFGTVSAAAAALTFDVERFLWVPGDKRIFLPPPPGPFALFKPGDVFTVEGVFAQNPITGRSNTWLKQFVVIDDVTALPALEPGRRILLRVGHAAD